MARLVIKNGLIVTPTGVITGGLAVEDDKITDIGVDLSLPKGKLEVDAERAYVVPGIIDPHVHLSAPNSGGRSEFKTESESAVISGVTMMMLFIHVTNPFEPRVQIYKKCKEIGNKCSFIDYKIHAYLMTDKHLEEIPSIINEGITSAKLLLGYGEEEAERLGIKAIDLGFAYKAMENLASYSPPVMLQAHCEQPEIISVITKRLISEGRNDLLAWSDSRPAISEAIHVYCLGLMSIETGCPVYIVHVSSNETVEVLKYLKNKGVKIYAETCPHYLTFTKNDGLGVLAKMAPPLRNKIDVNSLWQGLSEGIFHTIGSDHFLLHRSNKEKESIWEAIPGVGGIGAILPIIISEGVNKSRLSIEQFVKITSENAARLWGLFPKKGALIPGSDADIAIIDQHKEWTLSVENFKSSSDYSIYEGIKVRGKAIKTFVRGRLVADNGKLVNKSPIGKFVYPL